MRRNSQDFDLPRTLLGATPYLLAARFLEPEIMRVLAAAGADTHLPMKDGTTPLMAAAGMGIAPPALEERRGSDRRGLSILDGGTVEPESRVLATVTLALDLGGDIDAASPLGDTALHSAVAHGQDTVIQALVDRGANVNARTTRGQTPLALLLKQPVAPGESAASARARTVAVLRQRGATE
jgi:ankyrin repeat protein